MTPVFMILLLGAVPAFADPSDYDISNAPIVLSAMGTPRVDGNTIMVGQTRTPYQLQNDGTVTNASGNIVGATGTIATLQGADGGPLRVALIRPNGGALFAYNAETGIALGIASLGPDNTATIDNENGRHIINLHPGAGLPDAATPPPPPAAPPAAEVPANTPRAVPPIVVDAYRSSMNRGRYRDADRAFTDIFSADPVRACDMAVEGFQASVNNGGWYARAGQYFSQLFNVDPVRAGQMVNALVDTDVTRAGALLRNSDVYGRVQIIMALANIPGGQAAAARMIRAANLPFNDLVSVLRIAANRNDGDRSKVMNIINQGMEPNPIDNSYTISVRQAVMAPAAPLSLTGRGLINEGVAAMLDNEPGLAALRFRQLEQAAGTEALVATIQKLFDDPDSRQALVNWAASDNSGAVGILGNISRMNPNLVNQIQAQVALLE